MPLHLPVGKDAIAMYQSNAAKMAQNMEAWLPVATSIENNLQHSYRRFLEESKINDLDLDRKPSHNKLR
ncbi:hypothetical protein K9N68_13915 [Kovacikia minuta CCNUW1]|uniref:hypothetical protein n=1 Tax=Kovacikia minuta TaxID=2931930 RepID=UPI001CCF0D6E|nr:hypothetical protein [Kovacikia minuta]UBF28838.1 hypothetical protein K9N68_13915 [Kovacikia minuta CCNUW1]